MKVPSRKGSIFVEAALILPIVILSVAMGIGLASSLYEEVKEQTRYHEEQREAFLGGGKINKGEAAYIRNLDFLTEVI